MPGGGSRPKRRLKSMALVTIIRVDVRMHSSRIWAEPASWQPTL